MIPVFVPTLFMPTAAVGVPANAVVQRDGEIITLRDGTTIIVDERP
jgi:hypothetical protein